MQAQSTGLAAVASALPHVEYHECHDVERSLDGRGHQGRNVQPLEDPRNVWNESVIRPRDVRTDSTALGKWAALCHFADHQVPPELNRFRGAALSPNPGSRADHATSHGPNGSMDPTSRRPGGGLGDALGVAECERIPDNHSGPFASSRSWIVWDICLRPFPLPSTPLSTPQHRC